MSVWIVQGGNALSGEIKVQGAKNAVLPIMAASVLTGGITELENCPKLLDVEASLEILRHLGCTAEIDGDRIYIDSSGMNCGHIPHELMLKMRSSVMYMGAILARMGEARLSTPGGCELGSRPIDLHLMALKELGADVTAEGGEVICTAKDMRGTHINLNFPSVGATENAMIAACRARGETVITNAAREPEIYDLQQYLINCGAQISGAGSSVIKISGFEAKKYVKYRVMPDRIAASTFLCAAAAAGGDLSVTDVVPAHFETVTASLRGMGCGIVTGKDSVRLRRPQFLKACRPIVTQPYPGFPTDAQALVMAASLKAEGTTVFVENIFENRYRHADEMRRLGADIRTEGRVGMVTGVSNLVGAPLSAGDLRGGAALIIAAMSAEGESKIYDSGHVQRGYDDFAAVLQSVGAEVTFI